MENKINCIHILELFLVSLSLILQIICLATPGWLIKFREYAEEYSGVFYMTECFGATNQMCETKSWYDRYKVRMEYLLHVSNYSKELIPDAGNVNEIRKYHVEITFLYFYSIRLYPVTFGGRRGTTGDFATIPVPFVLFSAGKVHLC